MTARTGAFARNDDLEGLLRELNGALGPVSSALVKAFEPAMPTIFVVGAPRSGTTVLMQWLASSDGLAYPTNLLSRFYGAPYIGARIQQLLTDSRFDYRGELKALTGRAENFTSDLGKTQGPLEPNEFWYFWRRFIPLVDPEPLNGRPIDAEGLRHGLAELEQAFRKPFAAKAILFQYDLPLIAGLLPRSLFLYTRRDPTKNAISLLRAREAYWGRVDRWFSVKPPGTARLLGAPATVQVAGQILGTEVSLRKAAATIGPDRFLAFDHEAFCDDPEPVWQWLRSRCRNMGCDIVGEPNAKLLRRSHPPESADVSSWSTQFETARSLLSDGGG